MGKEIRIEREIKWDGEYKKWKAKLRVCLRAGEDYKILEIFRNRDKKLFGEALTSNWGNFYEDEEGGYYRIVECIDFFEEYTDAISYLNNYEIEALRIISEVTIFNAEQKKKELSKVDYYTLTQNGEVKKE